MTRTEEIVAQLNAYQDGESGDNIWDDVILRLDEYDEAATDKIEHGGGDQFALTDGSVIVWDPQTRDWFEQS